jgi:putative FmdB family regulatory protein
MPLYEYECPKCHHVAALSQKMDEAIPPMCCAETCNVEMVRVISKTSFQLAGSGWARDGYSSEKK